MDTLVWSRYEGIVRDHLEQLSTITSPVERDAFFSVIGLAVAHYAPGGSTQPTTKILNKKYNLCPFFGIIMKDEDQCQIPVPELGDDFSVLRFVPSKLKFSSYQAFLCYDAYCFCQSDHFSFLGACLRDAMNIMNFDDFFYLERSTFPWSTYGVTVDPLSGFHTSVVKSRHTGSLSQIAADCLVDKNLAEFYKDFIATARKAVGKKRPAKKNDRINKKRKCTELPETVVTSRRENSYISVIEDLLHNDPDTRTIY